MAEDPFAALSHLHPVDRERVAAARARQLSLEDATRLAGLLIFQPTMSGSDPLRPRYRRGAVYGGDLMRALDGSHKAAGYGLPRSRTAGPFTNRRSGRVIYNWLADDFPTPLREPCLRRLVDLTRSGNGKEDRTCPADAGIASSQPEC